MGHLDIAHLSHTLPDGRALLTDVSFRVGDGTVAALERLDEPRRRWQEEHARLCEIVRTCPQRAAISAGLASRYHAAQTRCGDQPFETLSGGQQARRQILLLELSGAALLLDEPTDKPRAGQRRRPCRTGSTPIPAPGWPSRRPLVRRSFDRFLVFGGDGSVHESDKPV